MDQTLLISILTPILLTVGGVISWFLKAKREESLNAETKSREYKIKTYKLLLEPFIATFTFTLTEKSKQKEINKLTTLEYKKTIFDLTTFGSDEAIRIFNKIMQTNFHAEEYKDENGEYTPEYGNRLIALISEFLMQIRRDLYSKKTKLKRSEMLEFMITDMEKTKHIINKMKL
tara:strand:+ start:90 stop:611 length:522 start_codon:yes stop_codon:yes gene_type:complete